MALLAVRCRRTWGTAKNPEHHALYDVGAGSVQRVLAGPGLRRFSLLAALELLLRAARNGLVAQSKGRCAACRPLDRLVVEQASAFRRNCAGQQKSGAAPRLLAAPPALAIATPFRSPPAHHLPPANRCRYSRRWRPLTQHLQRRPGLPFPQVRRTAAGAPRRESRPY
jgi:hypothetical protein